MDDIVKNHLRHIRLLQKEIAELESETAQKRSDERALTGQLQALLAEGNKTTGDPLWDLVIQAAGPDRVALKKYRALQKKLAGKKGEFVLIRYEAQVRERFGGEVRSTDFRMETHFRIGTLMADGLRLDEHGSVALPVKRYLRGVWPKWMTRTVWADGVPITGDLFERGGPDDQPPRLWQYLSGNRYASDMLIGDDAVRAALEEVEDAKFFATAAERLGRRVLQPT